MVAKAKKPALRQAFGLVIRELRTAAGLSQEQLSFLAKVHRTYIGDLERGLKSPTLDVVDAISRALKIEAPELLASAYRLHAEGTGDETAPRRQRVRK